MSKKEKRSFAPQHVSADRRQTTGKADALRDPDFVIELLSPTDNLSTTQKKMSEYMNCGVKLGWLINPDEKTVNIYRLGEEAETVTNPSSLSGEDILPGLVVDLNEIL